MHENIQHARKQEQHEAQKKCYRKHKEVYHAGRITRNTKKWYNTAYRRNRC